MGTKKSVESTEEFVGQNAQVEIVMCHGGG
jgi:hypothetical protein